MLASALKGYDEAGGVHLPMSTGILSGGRDNQVGYANRFEESGARLDPVRVGMYAREAAHIGFVIGQQQAMKERGAKSWRRVLHPELSKAGPCAQCTADAELTHSIDMPFFEFHPNGVCGMQSLLYSTGEGPGMELPLPYSDTPHDFQDYVKSVFERIKSLVRRLRK